VTFASEPYAEDYGIFPEIEAVSDLIQILRERNDIVLVVKLHPRENENKYSEFTKCIRDKETDSIRMIMVSDVIISISSMVLIEAAILGKK
jgi:CDP-glycerol glycerophosphotransferase (TagB/SpsB family)